MKALIIVLLAAGLSFAEAQHGQLLFGVPLIYYCTAIAFVIQWLAFIPAYKLQSEKFYDLTGSLTYLSVIGFLLLCAAELSTRDYLLAALVAIWALRLGSFLFKRVLQDGQDDRFDAIKPVASRFFTLWTLQGLWVTITAACALTAISGNNKVALGWLGYIGLAIWLAGFVIEVLADRQKRVFREQYGSGRFINTGLWRYSQHPNYFGEVLLWCGVALLALPALQGWQYLALISPVFSYLLITRVSGIPTLDAKASVKWQGNDAYQQYIATTSKFIPLPPRK